MSPSDNQLHRLMSLAVSFAAFLVFPAFLQGQTLTLNEAIHLAEAHNRSLQIAQLDQRKAADETSVARSYRLPVFSLTAIGSQSLSSLGLTLPLGSLATYPNDLGSPDTSRSICCRPSTSRPNFRTARITAKTISGMGGTQRDLKG